MTQPAPDLPPRPFSLAPAEVLAALAVDPARGLPAADVAARRARYGPNRLRDTAGRGLWSLLVAQFESVVVLLLAAAAALAFVFDDRAEGVAILAVIGVNALVGFLTEWRATRSMEALRRIGRVETVVVRDGQQRRIAAEELVPGDIVLREAGDIVSADLRLLEAASLKAGEAALTGEAEPVGKAVDPVAAETPLMDRACMLYKGTTVVRGSGRGVVVGTGFDTELGRIAELVSSAEPRETPLEKRLDALGARLARVVAIVAVVVAAGGLFAGRELLLAVEVAIALAVAAIPEGLPVVATLALARGMLRMAKRRAVIARLSAVETLGTTSVIVTDKTGTLTENRMALTEMRLAGTGLTIAEACDDSAALPAPLRDQVDALLEIAVLCSNAAPAIAGDANGALGDPTEAALLLAAERCGLSQANCRERRPEIAEIPFDPARKLMATLHSDGDDVFCAVKGAPEAVIDCCTRLRTVAGDRPLAADDRDTLAADTTALAGAGLRTLALACKSVPGPVDEPFTDLTFVGIVGLEDPARAGVAEAVARCHAAGIRVVMATGDHLDTARQIAVDVGIATTDTPADAFVEGAGLDAVLADAGDAASKLRVIARATPEQKLDLIGHFQERGEVVAMTGDGVNDAPALKKADIGIAMGIRGTAVAKESAAMVLQDDEFGTIVAAVEQGRAIYANIRKFVVYLFSCNISEVLVVLLATLAGAPLPLLPLQILFLNLVTDVFPALALGLGRGAAGQMAEPPRPAGESLVTREHWLVIVAHGLVLSVVVLAAMTAAIVVLERDARAAVTVSFCTLAFAQLWHVFNMREPASAIFKNEITANPWVWGALVLCVLLVVAALLWPALAGPLSLTVPASSDWLLILGLSVLPLLTAQPVRALARRLAGSGRTGRQE